MTVEIVCATICVVTVSGALVTRWALRFTERWERQTNNPQVEGTANTEELEHIKRLEKSARRHELANCPGLAAEQWALIKIARQRLKDPGETT